MKTSAWLRVATIGAGSLLSGCGQRVTCVENRTCAAPETAGSGGEAGAIAGSGGNDGGSSGAAGGGTAGGGTKPTLGGSCDSNGTVSCAGSAQAERLSCDGTHWQTGDACMGGELCDSSDGQCKSPVPECANATPGQSVCRTGDVPLTCGPDLVSAEVGSACAGTCQAGACVPASCGDGKVESNEQCDDKNSAPGDGCSASCQWEPVQLTGGDEHFCALGANGVVKCWGYDTHGQLGIGSIATIGDDANELGPDQAAVPLGTGRFAKAIMAGGSSSCALLDNASVKCWGADPADGTDIGDMPNELGDALLPMALGTGRTATALASAGCALLDDASLQCGPAGGASSTNVPSSAFGKGRTIKQAAVGSHNCALLDNESVACWGANNFGELGQGDKTTRNTIDPSLVPIVNLAGHSAQAIYVGWSNSCAILEDGTASCWGDNSYGQLAEGDVLARGDDPLEVGHLPILNPGSGRKITSMSIGQGYICAVLDDQTLRCWGNNYRGDLGLGSTVASVGNNPGETLDKMVAIDLGQNEKVQQVIATQNHTCALLGSGTVKCWGYNNHGSLGLGDIVSRGQLTSDMGDNLPALKLSF